MAPDEQARLEEVAQALRRLPAGAELRRALIDDSPEKDFIASEPGDSGTVVLVFCGLMDRVFFPIRTLDQVMAKLGMTAIYLRDSRRMVFSTGIESLGADFEATVAELRRRLDAVGGGDLVTLGNSAGGFAAIRYGVALGARRVLSLSGPTDMTRAFLQSIDDRRGKIVVRRLERHVSAEQLRARSVIETAAQPPLIDLIYSQSNDVDRRHAEELLGLPHVRLHPQGGPARHDVLTSLIARDALAPLLGRTAA